MPTLPHRLWITTWCHGPLRRLRATLTLGIGALLAALSLAAPAADLDEREARAVRTVIEAQLDAFAADDAERAFSYAAPAIRERFGDAPRFMAMVRQGYPMVIRPTTRAFFRPEAVTLSGGAAEAVQIVQVRDADGARWLAAYQLQRQPDQSWRITGCTIVPDAGGPST